MQSHPRRQPAQQPAIEFEQVTSAASSVGLHGQDNDIVCDRGYEDGAWRRKQFAGAVIRTP